MTIISEDRLSDSPYVESVSRGWTAGDGSTIRPAETNWHMVFSRHDGKLHPILVGPLTAAGVVSWTAGAEILWIKFKLGVFMPHLPAKNVLNIETILPGASRQAFWLNSATWPIPDYENVEVFVNRLVREDVLVRDPLVTAALQEELPEAAPRTLRHRFLSATGLSRNHIRQIERAQRAAAILRQGVSILDAVDQLGYFDQPHLTRSLKRWVGHTPAQIVRMSQPVACQPGQDDPTSRDGHVEGQLVQVR